MGEVSPVLQVYVSGQRELRPRSEGETSPVREICRDLRRQNVPKADHRPRSQRKVRTGDRKASDRGHLFLDPRRNRKAEDRGQYAYGPGTEGPATKPYTIYPSWS